MHTTILGGTLHGIEARLVRVEVDISSGLPGTRTVGLPEAAAREGNERVRAAIHNSGFEFPCKRIVINLAPADERKKGSALDLSVATAIVTASAGMDPEPLEGWVLYAELGLDGRTRPVPGALAAALAVRGAGLKGLVVAPENGPEAHAIGNVQVRIARSLSAVIAHVKGAVPLEEPSRREPAPGRAPENLTPELDLAAVKGQSAARRALEIAAAGGHNLILVGPPGSGKTMLARALAGILPALGHEESVEVTRIHGAVGTGLRSGLMRRRPFRSPHHTVSRAALVGGGRGARPGEVSLAHQGVLFMDELAECRPDLLEVLRQPLEEGVVSVARLARSLIYPASFMFVAAMNPCRCGHLGDPRKACSCNPRSVERYRARISGPLLDRIDLHVEVPALSFQELSSNGDGEGSAAVAERVRAARDLQAERYRACVDGDAMHAGGRAVSEEPPDPNANRSVALAGGGRREDAVPVVHPLTNARVPMSRLRPTLRLDAVGEKILEGAMTRLTLSARGHDRILRVARTIADLEGSDRVRSVHVAEAVQYRCLDRPVGTIVSVG